MKPFAFTSLIVTRNCNLKCSYCGFHLKEVPELSMQGWSQVIDTFGPHTEFFNIIGGEPMLYRYIVDVIRYLNHIGAKYSLSTNATLPLHLYTNLINTASVASISMSMDGITKWVDKYSEQKSKAAVRLIKHLREIDYTPPIVLSAVLTHNNIGDIPNIIEFASNHNCLVAMSVLQTSEQDGRDNSNTKTSVLPPTEKELYALMSWIVRNYTTLPMADPIEYFYALQYADKDWKCKHGTTPAIDCDGTILACFDFRGDVGLNAKNSLTIDEIRSRIRNEVKKCSGCFWGCPYISELLVDGVIDKSPFV